MASQQYINEATQQYDLGYNKKVQAYKNQLADNLTALEQQKTGINNNYDHQVEEQNLQNRLNKNNVSNAILGRGLNNSSIAVSGLAEQDAKNTRLVGNINRERTSALNNIDEAKAQQTRNTNATIAQLSADREDAIQTLARQLESDAWEKNYKNQQLQLQRENAQAEQAYRNASLAFQRENANRAYGLQREQWEWNKAQKEKNENAQAVLAQLGSDINSDDV